MTKVQEQIQVHDGTADFDFLIGTWTGHNRRLRERLKGSTSWEEFESTLTVRKILNGAGNIDEVTMNREAGHGLRFYIAPVRSEGATMESLLGKRYQCSHHAAGGRQLQGWARRIPCPGAIRRPHDLQPLHLV